MSASFQLIRDRLQTKGLEEGTDGQRDVKTEQAL